MPCGRRRAWDRSWCPLASVISLRLPGSVSLGVQVPRTPLPLPLSGTHGRCWYLKIASRTATGSLKQPSRQQLQGAYAVVRAVVLCTRSRDQHGDKLGSRVFPQPKELEQNQHFHSPSSWGSQPVLGRCLCRLWRVVREAGSPRSQRRHSPHRPAGQQAFTASRSLSGAASARTHQLPSHGAPSPATLPELLMVQVPSS